MTLIAHRFKPINKYLITSLIESQLYFCSPQKLNDPFDCRIYFEASLENAMKEASDSLKGVLEKAYTKEQLEKLTRKIEEVGVVCFSKQLCNTLMWSHYAENHSGLCLTYQIPEAFILENSEKILGWGEVDYGNEPIKNFFLSLNPDDSKDEFENFIKPLVVKLINSKDESWKYEEEFRIVSGTPGSIDIERTWLKQICFGLSTTDEDINLVKKIIKNHEYGEVEFYKMMKTKSHDFGYEAQNLKC